SRKFLNSIFRETPGREVVVYSGSGTNRSSYTEAIKIGRRTQILIDALSGQIRMKGIEVNMDAIPVLKELLVFFLRNAGQSFTKEQLAHFVWREIYNPLAHDSRIYTSVKR